MTLFKSLINILKSDDTDSSESDSFQRSVMLNFILFAAFSVNLIFSLAHILFFEKTVGYVLFGFFILFLLMFILFKKTNKYEFFSALSSVIFASLFILVTLIGAGNKTGLMWGLLFPMFAAFTSNFKNYNLYSISFLLVNFAVFFIPENFDFWADYSADIIMRYTFAYLVIYTFIGFYLKLKQQKIYKIEKELIETKHKLLEKDKFISTLSYDIRTPLNNIAGIINHQRDRINENVSEEIEISISNLASTINKISENPDINFLHIKANKTSFNINKIINKLTDFFQTEKYSKLKINLYLSPDIKDNVSGDKISFMQLLISSIDFFYNYSNESYLKLDIFSQKTGTDTINVKLSCKPENLIFPKNINTDNFIEEIKDLNIINKISESLNGKTNIIKTDKTFTLLFDFNFEKVNTEHNNNEKEAKSNLKPYRPKKIKLKDANILLVEDDVINSKVMTLNIRKYVNKIIIAENGKEAVDKFFENKVDIILMDIRMPYMDGFKTTEKIRETELGTGSHVPIIAVTANASSEVKKRCFEAGMNDYTTKPTNYKLLLKKMKNLLED